MKPKTLTTHDLKLRGWTPAMIRDLLGPHDATRPSEMRVGSRNRVVDAEVRLYREDRVITAESTEKFARHQEAARARQDAAGKATETRQARIEAQIAAYVDAYPAQIVPPDGAEGMIEHERWKHHLREFENWEFSAEADELLHGLKGRKYSEARGRAYSKFRAAYRAAYGLEAENA